VSELALDSGRRRSTPNRTASSSPRSAGLAGLQALAGNQAICRLVDGSPAASTLHGGGPVHPEVHEAIAELRGRGATLDPPAAAAAGRALGVELSGVRLHTGPEADLLGRSIGARAFTQGRDVFFRDGEYSPGTSSGRALLGHELAHVALQTTPAVVHAKAAPGEVTSSDDPVERAADQVGARVAEALSGRSADLDAKRSISGPIPASGGSDTTAIHRAVGFEFQTGWGLTRSLTAAPHPLGVGIDPDDRDVETQAHYPDVAVTHGLAQPNNAVPAPTRALPPPRTGWEKMWGLNKPPALGPSPTTPTNPNNFPQGAKDQDNPVSDTMYMSSYNLMAYPTQGRVQFKYHKGQVLKNYGDFKMTVDDATTPLGAELEWVVDPPVSDSASVKDMGKVMDHLLAAVKKFLKFKSRESFLLSEVTGDQADDQVEIQPAVKGGTMRDMDAAAQATGGVNMDQLLTLFSDVGGKGAKSSNLAATASGELMGSAFAGQMYDVAANVEGSPRLKGLVGYISRYLAMGAATTPLTYAKVNTQFLARTDFATMFDQLPDPEKRKYGGPNKYGSVGAGDTGVDEFVDLVLKATGVAEDRKIFNGGVKSGNGVKDIDLTARQWLEGIPEGEDRLSSRYWKDISKDLTQTQTVRNDAASMRGELESMGNLRKTDDVGDNGADPGIIMEFRSNTMPRAVGTWKPYAVSVFSYIKELNRR
jgi:hypothetical protein